MIGSRRVLRRRLWWCVLASAVGGCWSSEPLIDDTFTADQWERLKSDYAPPIPPNPCDVWTQVRRPGTCDQAAALGQALFFEPALSHSGAISCASCHDPGDPDAVPKIDGWFADIRTPNNVSAADSGWTKRNSPSVINVSLKDKYAPATARGVFSWTGKFTRSGAVLRLAIDKALKTNDDAIAAVIHNNPIYLSQYIQLFGTPSPSCSTMPPSQCELIKNLELVFEVYMNKLVSVNSPFDLFIADLPSPLSESAKRGFGVFVGRGMCAECHGGKMFSDFTPHDTGVPQMGVNVFEDGGRADDHGGVAMDPADAGLFITPSLRNIAKTGPYMHDGAFTSLAEVIAFYRAGGVPSGYAGVRDARIQKGEMTDEDARDLEAFLNSLTGTPIPPELCRDVHPRNVCTIAGDANPGTVCGTACVDLQLDPKHCGSCDKQCATNEVCMGTCFPTAPMCSPPAQNCHGFCLDFQADPQNCGSCGHTCADPTPTCVTGTCR
ncbi:MAG: uncharacterized protein JWO36_5648 [Myxococcales bacterium]|nr:uncharacterized protein [Myxococcales bacterium]